jgi:hypothetical protein
MLKVIFNSFLKKNQIHAIEAKIKGLSGDCFDGITFMV